MSIQPIALRLAEGVREINKCYYYKDENGVVTVSAAIKRAEPFKNPEIIATLPEGYRPKDWVELPATFGSSAGGRFAGTSSLASDGSLYVIFDPSVKPNWAYMQFSYLLV
jgi:hypothetical protein